MLEPERDIVFHYCQDPTQALAHANSIAPTVILQDLVMPELDGLTFSYHWLDDEHFAVFLLDVSGHGVGSSLMSVSALNVLRSQALPHTDFRDPSQVLQGLNAAFSMDLHARRLHGSQQLSDDFSIVEVAFQNQAC